MSGDQESEGPPATRFAVLTPYAAAWMINRLRRSGVNSAAVRRDVEMYRSAGALHEAEHLARAWAQLRAAAGELPPAAANGSTKVDHAETVEESKHDEITTSQAADLLRCTARRVRQLVEDGKLDGRRVGRAWLVDRQMVEDLARRRAA